MKKKIFTGICIAVAVIILLSLSINFAVVFSARGNIITEEEYDELNDNVDKFVELDIPVLTMRDDFNNRLISVYVTSVSVFKKVLVISGFEQPLYSDLEIKDYHSCDVYACQIAEIFKYIK